VKLLYEAFVTSVYNESWSINNFEHIFVGIINPVVVAQLQRTIAAKSDCLILMGGPSSFQDAALAMYMCQGINFQNILKQFFNFKTATTYHLTHFLCCFS